MANVAVPVQGVEAKYRKHMAKLLAHVPDTSALAVLGTSVAATLEQQASKPITLDEVLVRLREKWPEAAARYEELRRARAAAALEAAAQELQARLHWLLLTATCAVYRHVLGETACVSCYLPVDIVAVTEPIQFNTHAHCTLEMLLLSCRSWRRRRQQNEQQQAHRARRLSSAATA